MSYFAESSIYAKINEARISDVKPPDPPSSPIPKRRKSPFILDTHDMFDGPYMAGETQGRKLILITGFPATIGAEDVDSFVSAKLDSSVTASVVNFDEWTGEAIVEVNTESGKYFYFNNVNKGICWNVVPFLQVQAVPILTSGSIHWVYMYYNIYFYDVVTYLLCKS